MQSLRIARPSKGQWYYIEYRRPYGVFDNFAETDAAVNGVSICINPSFLGDIFFGTDNPRDSKLLAPASQIPYSFRSGFPFVDQIENIAVKVLSLSSNSAQIQIYLGPSVVEHSYLLTVERTGRTDGYITAPPSGIKGGMSGKTQYTDCNENYLEDTYVTLTAYPNRLSDFLGWSGICSGTQVTCTLTIDAVKTVTANFCLWNQDFICKATQII